MPHEFKQWLLSPKLIRRVGWHMVPTLTHWCPGCNCEHDFAVEEPFPSGAKWTYNGDPLHPSFSPSMNYQLNPKGHKHYQPDLPSKVCHYFIRLGSEVQVPPADLLPGESYIQFLGDCTHALQGLIVPLPDLPIRHAGTHRFFGSTIITEEPPA